MDSLDQLAQEIIQCQACELRMNATCPVPGYGELEAKYFLIGEAPGKFEDEAGIPFVGSAGRRLDKLLELANIDINDCFLSNVCRCRPSANRDPKKKEIKACVDFLWREIDLVRPQYLMTLGSVPLSLFCPYGVRQTHGTQLDVEVHGRAYTLLSMYHPAAALHQPRLWADLLDDFENMPEKVPSDFTILSSKMLNLKDRQLASLDTEQDGSGGLGQWSIAYRYQEGGLAVFPFFGVERHIKFNCPIVFHNAKYDLRVLRANKMQEPKEIHDTMIMAYCLGLGKQAPKDSSKTKSGSDMVGGLGLKYLTRRHLGMQMKRWDEVKDNPEEIPEYNARDSVATYLLAEKWLPILPKHYFEIDMPLLPVLMAVEDRGVQIDPDFLQEFAKELDNRLADFNIPLNVHARAEVQSYIYGTLDIEPWKFTDTGEPSVDADVLEVIKDPLVEEILAYKQLYTDKASYVEDYVRNRDVDNRVHPEVKQTSTSTGRLSVARPHMQNMDKEGDMRKLVVVAEGKKLVRMDYDQLEWRVLAAITQDPTLLKALESGKKIHQVTAEQMNVSYDDAKTANFAIQYGAKAWMLAQHLHCTIGQAKEFIKTYFEKFLGVKAYQEQMKETALSEKKVTNWFGRTRRIDAMYVDQWRVREEGIKEAINMPIQGAGGEICKITMIALHKHNAPMVLQVHDELLFEIPEKEAEEYGQWLKEYIPTLVEINGVKFPVDIKIGNNWWECSK